MSRLLRAIASNYAVLGVQAAYLLVLTPLIVAHAGAQTYGRWVLVLAVVAYLRLLDLGVGPTTARFVAAARDEDGVSTTISTSVAALGAIAVVGVIASAAIGSVALGGGTDSTFELALSVAVASRAIQLPLAVAGYALYGLDRIFERNVFSSLRSAASLLAVAGVVLAGAKLVGLIVAGACAELLVGLAQLLFLIATAPGVHISPRRVNSHQMRSTIRFTGGVLVLSLTSLIIVNSDTVVIGAFLGSSTVAVYAIAMRVIEGSTMMLNQTSDVFLPIFAREQQRGQDTRVREMVRVATRATSGLSFAIIGVFISFGDRLIELWVGPGFGSSWLPLLLLAGGLVFNAPLRYAVLWSIAGDKHRALARFAIAETIANVTLSVGLIFPFGVRGVAAASLVTFTIWNGWLIPRVVFSQLVLSWTRDFLRPLFLGAVTTLTTAFALRAALAGISIGPLPLLVLSLTWFLALAASLAGLLLGATDRRAVWRALSRSSRLA